MSRNVKQLNKFSTKYCYDNEIKEDKLGGACGTHGRDEKCIQNFGKKT